VIAWWVAEVASQEGGHFFLVPECDPHEEPNPAHRKIPDDLDEQLIWSVYQAPGWLRRIGFIKGTRGEPQANPLSLLQTKQEISFIQWELWEDINATLHKQRLKATFDTAVGKVTIIQVSPPDSINLSIPLSFARVRINTEYERIYAVMKTIGVLASPGKLKLDQNSLKTLCAALDEHGIPLPEKRRTWDDGHWKPEDRNWTSALVIDPDRVKSFLANVPKRRQQGTL
jgi:hypothetical protein